MYMYMYKLFPSFFTCTMYYRMRWNIGGDFILVFSGSDNIPIIKYVNCNCWKNHYITPFSLSFPPPSFPPFPSLPLPPSLPSSLPPSLPPFLRNLCCDKYPEALPKLLQSVTWSNRSDVAQVSSIIIIIITIIFYMVHAGGHPALNAVHLHA